MRAVDIEPIVRVAFSISIAFVFVAGIVLGFAAQRSFEELVAGRTPSESLRSFQNSVSIASQLALFLAVASVGIAWYETLRHRGPIPQQPPSAGLLLVLVGSLLGVLGVVPRLLAEGRPSSFGDLGRSLLIGALTWFGWPLIVLGLGLMTFSRLRVAMTRFLLPPKAG